jgi:hypothetical protein
MAGFNFVRVRETLQVFDYDQRFLSIFLPELEAKNEISVLNWLEICKQVSDFFPNLVITEIFREITSMMCAEGGFRKENIPGIYLLSGADLLVLKLTKNVRLKRIL